MKYIKKYTTGSEFTQNGNTLDFTYYVNGFNTDGYVSYDIRSDDEGEEYEPLQCKGSVKEITPGVAYVVDSGASFYNGSFPVINFQFDWENRTYPWSDFGITEEIYNNYIKKVKAFAHPSEMNITLDTTLINQVIWQKGNEEETGFITLGNGTWAVKISTDGTVYIYDNRPA